MARNTTIQLRCSVAEKDRWHEAAQVRGMELSAWARQLMNQAAERAPKPDRLVDIDLFPEPKKPWEDQG